MNNINTDNTLERFIKLKGSKALSYEQCRLFGVKDLKKGWFNRYKFNVVDDLTWAKAVETLGRTKRATLIKEKGGIRTLQHLYLFRSSSGLYKIGISQNVKRRASNIRTASGFDIEILSVWNTGNRDAKSIESAVHEHLKDFRIIGEWFKFSEDYSVVDIFDSFVQTSTTGSRKIRIK